jgi:serine/threonine protein kinase
MPTLSERLARSLAERYAIERQIGEGGMATVFLARDLRHGRRVAIKVLREDVAERMAPGSFAYATTASLVNCDSRTIRSFATSGLFARRRPGEAAVSLVLDAPN